MYIYPTYVLSIHQSGVQKTTEEYFLYFLGKNENIEFLKIHLPYYYTY